MFVQAPSIALIEPVIVPEITCSALGRIEFMGAGQGCFVVYRNTISPTSGEYERQICGRVYAPLEAIPGAVDLMLRGLIEAGLANAAQLGRRMLS